MSFSNIAKSHLCQCSRLFLLKIRGLNILWPCELESYVHACFWFILSTLCILSLQMFSVHHYLLSFLGLAFQSFYSVSNCPLTPHLIRQTAADEVRTNSVWFAVRIESWSLVVELLGDGITVGPNDNLADPKSIVARGVFNMWSQFFTCWKSLGFQMSFSHGFHIQIACNTRRRSMAAQRCLPLRCEMCLSEPWFVWVFLQCNRFFPFETPIKVEVGDGQMGKYFVSSWESRRKVLETVKVWRVCPPYQENRAYMKGIFMVCYKENEINKTDIKDVKQQHVIFQHSFRRCGALGRWRHADASLFGFIYVRFPRWFPTISKHAQTQALRSQTRSVSGTQKKLKIFENSCPRQLLKLACTGLHLQSFIVWETSCARIANWHFCGYRYGMICAETKGMLGFLNFIFSLVIPDHIQTCTDSSIKESDQERQRHAEEVEDLRKQLSKAAAEACLHWLALAIFHCVGNIMCTDCKLTFLRV